MTWFRGRLYFSFRHLIFFSLSIFYLCDRKELCLSLVHRSLLLNTKDQQSYRNLLLPKSKVQHSQKYHNMFFFFNCTWLPSQNRTVYIYSKSSIFLHWKQLYFMVWYLYVLFLNYEGNLSIMLFVWLLLLFLFMSV
jgi:hypothetical protein